MKAYPDYSRIERNQGRSARILSRRSSCQLQKPVNYVNILAQQKRLPDNPDVTSIWREAPQHENSIKRNHEEVKLLSFVGSLFCEFIITGGLYIYVYQKP